ncbi:MAG: hypothetical protein AB7O62_14635 [Pirellulales bacterium]
MLLRTASSLQRRKFLQRVSAGFGGLALPDLLRLRAAASGRSRREPTAVILLWTTGGMSQIETYDPKPDAPLEYRGEFQPIATSTPGL